MYCRPLPTAGSVDTSGLFMYVSSFSLRIVACRKVRSIVWKKEGMKYSQLNIYKIQTNHNHGSGKVEPVTNFFQYSLGTGSYGNR